jgi:soluble P-type ATPase
MEQIELKHLILDYNGTIAINGALIEGVLERLKKLSPQLSIHVLTADTYGSVHEQCEADFLNIHVIGKEKQDEQKLSFIKSLGINNTVAIGNGRNDALMLKSAILGFAILQDEGISICALNSADVVFVSIIDALDALLIPNRLIATLRN